MRITAEGVRCPQEGKPPGLDLKLTRPRASCSNVLCQKAAVAVDAPCVRDERKKYVAARIRPQPRQGQPGAIMLQSIHFGPFRDDFAAAQRQHFPSVFRTGLRPHSLSLSLFPPSAVNRQCPLVAAIGRAGMDAG